MTNEIKPYQPPPNFGALKKVPTKPAPQAGSMQARLAAAKKLQATVEEQAAVMPNRLALLLDISGSMSGDKIQKLKEATESFVDSLNLSGSLADTSVACRTFPYDETVASSCYPLTCDQTRARLAAWNLNTLVCTPMHEAMQFVLENYSVTRGVMMSDGAPDSKSQALLQAGHYKDAGIPIDCVHIGHEEYGADLLKQVAEITGGLFIKFTDINSFAKNFKYLSPALRPLMLSGQVGAAELGAAEVKGGGK